MLKRMPAALAVLMLLTLAARAEESKPPYDVKVEGDKLENVKIIVVENTPVDRSSAKATVESYNRLVGFFSELFFTEKYQDFRDRMESITDPAERALNEKLFSGACLDEMSALKKKQEAEQKEKEAKDLADGKPPYRRVPPKITGEKTEGGNTIIEVEETSEWSTRGKDGKWETTTSISNKRYICAAKDGIWQIDRCDKYEQDYKGKPDENGQYPRVWVEDKIMAGMLTFFAAEGEQAAAPMPEIDTPEKLARTALTWLTVTRRTLTNKLALEFFAQLTDRMKPMFTERHIKDAQTEADKQNKEQATNREKDMKEKLERKLTSKDLGNGSVEVTIAARNEWSAEIVLTVSKEEKGLRISKAVLRRFETNYKDGKEEKIEKLEPLNSPSQLDWN